VLVERLTFKAKFGHGDELVALFKEFWAKHPTPAVTAARIYTDYTGGMFTVQLESEVADIAAYADYMKQDREGYGTADFQSFMTRLIELSDGGDRQLLNVEHVL
jgi:hypothetical protein